MNRKKHVEIIAIFVLIVLLISFATLYISLRKNTSSASAVIKVFYYDPIARELVPEEHEITGEGNYKYYKAFELIKTPEQKNLFPVVFDDTSLLNVELKEGVLTVNLKIDESKANSLTLKREYAFVYGLVNTFTQFKEVESVKIKINNNDKDLLSHYVDISKPLTNYPQNLPKSIEVNLFFPSPDLENLAVERREIAYIEDPVEKGKSILKELFSGSRYGLPSIFSLEMLSSFSLKSGGTATVSLNREYLPKGFGSNLEKLFVMCIVNSLTEVRDIQKVEILVDGKQVDTLFGSIYLKVPLARFLTDGSKEIIPYFYMNYLGNDIFIPIPKVVGNINVEGIFESLKESSGLLETKIPKDASIVSTSAEGNTLNISISLGYTPSAKELEIIKRQMVLSFTEFTDFDTIKLSIGEETFILKR